MLTKSYRIQAQILNLGKRRLLWINSYLPTDPQTVVRYDDTELLEVLAEVESILSSVPHTDVVWAGDLNWEISRRSAFAGIVADFVEKVGVVPLWTHHPVDFTHTHTDYKSVTTLDHFLISPQLLHHVAGCGVINR